MVTRERVLELMEKEATRPLSESELAEMLVLETVEELVALKVVLKEMEAEGELIFTRKKRYGLPSQLNLMVGRLSRHPKGFGFLISDDPEVEDLYINANDLGGAMHNDRVVARIRRPASVDELSGTRFRAEGEVIRILKRSYSRVLGTFESSQHFGFVVPDDSRFGGDIFVAKEDFGGAVTGMKVVVELTRYPEKTRSAEGKVVEVIGMKGDPGIDVISVIYKHDLPQSFPEPVLQAAEAIPDHVLPEEMEGRRDLRDLLMVTIDGDDSKDLDDAVSLQRLEDGLYRLGVHIADVGHYVREDSILDKEALARATSIYLVDRVIPMLPQRLSNGICSLNEGQDRLSMTCFMNIDSKGVVVAHEICESVINVDHRMTYKNVAKILDQDAELRARYSDIVPMLEEMAELKEILERKRMRRGAIEFDVPESKVLLDDQGKPMRIEWRQTTLADEIIEEFMLCANETVAEHYFWLEVPFLYRVHEEPKEENVQDVNKFLQAFGYSLKYANGTVHPKSYQSIVDEVHGKPEEKTINSVLLRSMQHARYDTEPLGHFGLSAKYYSHFTSPIRRYPDLAIHRVIKECLHQGDKLSDKRLQTLSRKMDNYAEQSTIREKVAEEAERESVDMKKVEYMLPFEGEVFPAIISGVTGFGFFVQLENSVEGLVHISNLIDDFYTFNPDTYTLLGEHTRKQYQIGQPVTVRLTKVNVDERQLDFEVLMADGSRLEQAEGDLAKRPQRPSAKNNVPAKDSKAKASKPKADGKKKADGDKKKSDKPKKSKKKKEEKAKEE